MPWPVPWPVLGGGAPPPPGTGRAGTRRRASGWAVASSAPRSSSRSAAALAWRWAGSFASARRITSLSAVVPGSLPGSWGTGACRCCTPTSTSLPR
ncbi:hypothetical protein [Nocardioides zeae]